MWSPSLPIFYESHYEVAHELQDSADEVPRNVPHGLSTPRNAVRLRIHWELWFAWQTGYLVHDRNLGH
ncbi:hypothetical protein E6O75_ATG07019 [Venturia nashicola]|uniref:Uncharacterized protein n=1 Tax=Venturia nashicola TaxID=86259 RepID=A0A4Z1PED7_9PEZI|nr:hypothetical protein E6O75_ATG07019 [Venturia nashicola]